MTNKVDIPMDVYESWDEIVIVLPLGGVSKNSIEVYLEKTKLIIKADRKQPKLKSSLNPLQQECFWGEFTREIQLPQNVYFNKIHTKMLDWNILMIVVPKVIIPDKMKLDIDFK